jgi:hypothetical protein
VLIHAEASVLPSKVGLTASGHGLISLIPAPWQAATTGAIMSHRAAMTFASAASLLVLLR